MKINLVALLIAMTGMLALSMVSLSAYGVTPAGTPIETSGTIQYGDIIVTAEVATVIVSETYGITIEQVVLSAHEAPGATYYFNHVLTNLGNTTNSVMFYLVTPESDTWTYSIVKDNDWDGIHDDDEDDILTNPLPIAEGAIASFFIAVTPPVGESLTVTREVVTIASGIVDDGSYYIGANGEIFGGPDSVEAHDVLTTAMNLGSKSYLFAFYSGYEINYVSVPFSISGITSLDDLTQNIGSAWKDSGLLEDLDGLELEIYDNVTKVSKGYVYYGYDGSAWVEAQPPGGDTSVSIGDAVMVHLQPHIYGDLQTRNLAFTWEVSGIIPITGEVNSLSFYSGYEINYCSLPFCVNGITNLDELAQSIGSAWKNSGQLDEYGLDGLELETYDNITKVSRGYVYYGYDGSAWVEAQPPGGDTSLSKGDAVMVHIQPHLYGDLMTRELSFQWP